MYIGDEKKSQNMVFFVLNNHTITKLLYMSFIVIIVALGFSMPLIKIIICSIVFVLPLYCLLRKINSIKHNKQKLFSFKDFVKDTLKYVFIILIYAFICLILNLILKLEIIPEMDFSIFNKFIYF